MPRSATGINLSIAQLEQVLRARKSQLQKLAKQRNKIARELAKLDARIGMLGGDVGRGGFGGAGGRARNEKSLVEMIEGVLGKSGKAMGVGDIVDAVQKGGYKSNSANFRGIVNQTLIKEKQFSQAGRGVYQLKK
jgi:hypothetical protein